MSHQPPPTGGGHIVFGVDPVGVGITVTVSCPHNTSRKHACIILTPLNPTFI